MIRENWPPFHLRKTELPPFTCWQKLKELPFNFPSRFTLTMWTWIVIAALRFGAVVAIIGNAALSVLYYCLITWDPLPDSTRGACRRYNFKRGRTRPTHRSSRSKKEKMKLANRNEARKRPKVETRREKRLTEMPSYTKSNSIIGRRASNYPRELCSIAESSSRISFSAASAPATFVSEKRTLPSLPAERSRSKRIIRESKSEGCRRPVEGAVRYRNVPSDVFALDRRPKSIDDVSSLLKSEEPRAPSVSFTSSSSMISGGASQFDRLSSQSSDFDLARPLILTASNSVKPNIRDFVQARASGAVGDATTEEEEEDEKEDWNCGSAETVIWTRERLSITTTAKESVDTSKAKESVDTSTAKESVDTSTSTSQLPLSDAEDFEFDFDYDDSSGEEWNAWAPGDGVIIANLNGNYNNNNNSNNDDDDIKDDHHDVGDYSSASLSTLTLAMTSSSGAETAQKIKGGEKGWAESGGGDKDGMANEKGRASQSMPLRQTRSEVVGLRVVQPDRNATFHVVSQTDPPGPKGKPRRRGLDSQRTPLASPCRPSRAPSICGSKSRNSSKSGCSNFSLFNDNEIWTPKENELFTKCEIVDGEDKIEKPTVEWHRDGVSRDNAMEDFVQSSTRKEPGVKPKQPSPSKFDAKCSQRGNRDESQPATKAPRGETTAKTSPPQNGNNNAGLKGGDDGRGNAPPTGFRNKTEFVNRRRSVSSLPGLRRIDYVAAAPLPTSERTADLKFHARAKVGGAPKKRIEYVGRFKDNADADADEGHVTKIRSISSSRIASGNPGKEPRIFLSPRRELQRLPRPRGRSSSSSLSRAEEMDRAGQDAINRCHRKPMRRRAELQNAKEISPHISTQRLCQPEQFERQRRPLPNRTYQPPMRQYLRHQLSDSHPIRQENQRVSKGDFTPRHQICTHATERQLAPQDRCFQEEVEAMNRNSSNITPSEFERSETSFLERREKMEKTEKTEKTGKQTQGAGKVSTAIPFNAPPPTDIVHAPKHDGAAVKHNHNVKRYGKRVAQPDATVARAESITSAESIARRLHRPPGEIEDGAVGFESDATFEEDFFDVSRNNQEWNRGMTMSEARRGQPFLMAVDGQSEEDEEERVAKWKGNKKMHDDERREKVEKREEVEKRKKKKTTGKETREETRMGEAMKREAKRQAEMRKEDELMAEKQLEKTRAKPHEKESEKAERRRRGGGGGGGGEKEKDVERSVSRRRAEADGVMEVRVPEAPRNELNVGESGDAKQVGKSSNRRVESEESNFDSLYRHFNENHEWYERLLLGLFVIACWHWQTGGFGEKKEFQRHLKSASASAAAAATVADGIAAVERNKMMK